MKRKTSSELKVVNPVRNSREVLGSDADKRDIISNGVKGKILTEVNPVRNSSGALNPTGIILKPNPAAEQRGIISNGVNKSDHPSRASG